ncbi:MAG TPA: alpha/beta hydrolase [Steroidobacteraceae bacterium]|nr:alpha/beta hydrolase [Steroidobacteraceae bacterium]
MSVLLLSWILGALGPQQASAAALPPPTQRESIPGAEVSYLDSPVGNGDRVRIIVTRPQGARGPFPVAFLVGWLSCDSVSWPQGPMFGLAHAWIDIARGAGYMTVRMEKPGVGDSVGPPCAKLDFERELAAYRAAYVVAMSLPDADATRVAVVGMSNGGGFAPLVPDRHEPRGYVVIGGWLKTWYEHMLEYERRRLTLAGTSPGEINATLARYETFYELYLIEGMTPGEVLRRHPEMRRDWQDADDGQFGRPAAFFQQLQRTNVAEAWSRVRVPVLAVHGEYDWIMSADDHREMVRMSISRGMSMSRELEAPRTTHLLERVDDAKEALEGSGAYNAEAGAEIVAWLKALAEHPPR